VYSNKKESNENQSKVFKTNFFTYKEKTRKKERQKEMRCYQTAPRQQLASVINKSESKTRKRKWGRRVVSRAILAFSR